VELYSPPAVRYNLCILVSTKLQSRRWKVDAAQLHFGRRPSEVVRIEVHECCITGIGTMLVRRAAYRSMIALDDAYLYPDYGEGR